mgnify:FL=1
MKGSRERILQRVQEGLGGRPAVDHPGSFPGGYSQSDPTPADLSSLERFRENLEKVGGEVFSFPSSKAARAWLKGFASDFDSVAFGETVPSELRVREPAGEPAEAGLGVSMARCAIAETGSLVLEAGDGRRTQLLPHAHVVWVMADTVHETALTFLQGLSGQRVPSVFGLHSGPSNSADIGQIMVRGVHGPGRLIAGIIG